MDTRQKNYDDGYRNGHLDRLMDREMSVIATTYPDHCLPGYAQGYYDGYNNLEHYTFAERRTNP